MPKKVQRLEYSLEIIDGYMRPIFEEKGRKWNELMWELLLPFPQSAAAMLEEVERVRDGESEGWVYETPETRIICASKTLIIEQKLKGSEDRGLVKIELPLREAVLLIWRWTFECVWRESQAPGADWRATDNSF